MRPCTALKPCDCFMKYAVVLDEQPMPLIFAARCGGTSSSQQRLHERGGHGVVPAPGAERGHRAFVVALREPE